MEMKQLDKVALVARSEETRAAGEVQQQQNVVEQSQQRLQQLEQFRSEYQLRLKAMAESGMGARTLSDYRQFLTGLNHAIAQQGEEVQRSEAQLAQGREGLMDSSLRRGSLDELINRTRAALIRDGLRVEQLQSDEMSLQRFESE